MDERRLSLIQRAAARIAQQSPAESPVPSPEATTPPSLTASMPRPIDEPVEDRPSPGKRSREITIDRGRLARAGIALPSSERSRIAEEFRLIKRGVLRNAAADARGRLIMITSTRPREGKTYTSLNLALSVASEKDMRVLLIDCDVHQQSLAATLGLGTTQGLVDLLADTSVDIPDVLLRTNIPNLTVLPSGKSGPHVPELLSSNRMSDLVTEMVRRYPDRFIILDAPPCLATSDPSILASLVGQIIFVVEANQTQEHEIEAALRLISSCPTISLVLNKTRGAASDQFGSYSYY